MRSVFGHGPEADSGAARIDVCLVLDRPRSIVAELRAEPLEAPVRHRHAIVEIRELDGVGVIGRDRERELREAGLLKLGIGVGVLDDGL